MAEKRFQFRDLGLGGGQAFFGGGGVAPVDAIFGLVHEKFHAFLGGDDVAAQAVALGGLGALEVVEAGADGADAGGEHVEIVVEFFERGVVLRGGRRGRGLLDGRSLLGRRSGGRRLRWRRLRGGGGRKGYGARGHRRFTIRLGGGRIVRFGGRLSCRGGGGFGNRRWGGGGRAGVGDLRGRGRWLFLGGVRLAPFW